MVRVRLTQIQAITRPDHLWPEIWSGISQAAQRKEKLQWAIDKPKLDNARKWRGINFIDPDDKEFKETMEIARKKFEIPMEAAMPLDTGESQFGGWEACFSSVRKMVNIIKPSKTQGESWKFQCLARKGPRNSPSISKLKQRVVNPTRFQ